MTMATKETNTETIQEAEYKSYILRRQILADADMAPYVREALILVEYMDWHTGAKEFESAEHVGKWFKWLGKRNGITDPKVIWCAAKAMKQAGYVTLLVAGERRGIVLMQRGVTL